MITSVGLLLAAAALSVFPDLSNARLTSARPRTVEVGSGILDASFDQWLQNLTSFWGMKGLAVAVVQRQPNDTWSIETKGYGVKNAAGDSVTEDTMFAIGSNSKLFAVLALGKQLDNSNGSLQWTTKIADILEDDWKLEDPIAQKHANLLDILSHRTGLPRHDFGGRRGETVAQAVRALRFLRPSTEFRETFQYNNWMYTLVTHIIQRVSGLRFSDYVQQNIISQLPFRSATYNSTKAKLSGQLADGFSQVKRNVSSGGLGWSRSTYEPTRFGIDLAAENIVAGPGGVIMSVYDVTVWLQTLLLNGKHPETGESVIPPEAISTAASGITIEVPYTPFPELSVWAYGAGQELYSYQGHNIVEHNGGVPGFLTLISRAPQDGLGVAVFTNWDEGGLILDIIKFYLYEKALGLPHVDWSSRTLAGLEAAAASATKPKAGSPHNSTNKFAGTYINPAYGRYDLCPPPSGSPSSRCALSDEYWQLVQRSNASESSVTPSLSVVAPAVFANYLQLYRASDTAFTVSAFEITTTPEDAAEQKQIVVPLFNSDPSIEFATIEFATSKDGNVEGFGLRGVWGAGGGVESPTGKTVRERAEVWFDRVR